MIAAGWRVRAALPGDDRHASHAEAFRYLLGSELLLFSAAAQLVPGGLALPLAPFRHTSPETDADPRQQIGSITSGSRPPPG